MSYRLSPNKNKEVRGVRAVKMILNSCKEPSCSSMKASYDSMKASCSSMEASCSSMEPP